jgi:hypothetical protein
MIMIMIIIITIIIIIIICISIKVNSCHSKEERGFCCSGGTINNKRKNLDNFLPFWDIRKPPNYRLPPIGYGNRNDDKAGK